MGTKRYDSQTSHKGILARQQESTKVLEPHQSRIIDRGEKQLKKIEKAVSLVKEVSNYDPNALKALNNFKIELTSESDGDAEYHEKWEEYYHNVH